MNKVFSSILSVIMMGALLVGCGPTTTNESDGKTIEGSLETTLTKITEPLNQELMTMNDAVDLSDKEAVKYHLGLDSNKGIKEAYVSNAMISTQAHAVAIVKVDANTDAKKLAKDMVDGVDPMKWICVGADDIQTAVYGDLILLVMTDSSLQGASSDDYVKSFETLAGSSVDATYKR